MSGIILSNIVELILDLEGNDMEINKMIGSCGLAYLDRNDKAGIKYHKEDGSKGDYDKLDTEQEIIKLIKRGE